MSNFIICDTHGEQTKAYVCAHLIGSMRSSVALGLFFEIDEDGCPNAWCFDCENRLQAADNNWTPELMKFADIKVICKSCFDRLQELNAPRGTMQ